MWNTDTGEYKLTLEGHTDGVTCLAFSPDGSTLASGGYDNMLRLWDAETGQHKPALEGHTDYIRSVVFSPDGRTLASGSYDRTLRLWDAETEQHRQTLEGHTSDVTSVAFSPDGRTLVSGGEDNTFLLYDDTVRLWDAETGQYLQSLRGHTDGVTSVAFSRDGSMLASGSYDNTIQVWELTPAMPIVEPSQTVTSVSEPAQLAGDLNADGVVNIQDLVLVALQFGQTGQHTADINEDGVVNIQDLVLIAGAFDTTASAPAAHSQVVEPLTAGEVQRWLRGAKQLEHKDATVARGIEVLKDLLALLTPVETALLHNYPNPFNPETWIPYQLKTPTEVRIAIYDLRGVLVRELSLGYQVAGRYTSRARAAYWDGRNTVGEPVTSGLYFYTLTAGDFSATRRMVILNEELYAIADEEENLRIYRLSTDTNTFVPIQGIPAFHKEMLSAELWKSITEAKYLSFFDGVEMNSRLITALHNAATRATTGGFAVSDGTFYVEYQRVLFKWKSGDSEWTNTGLIDLTERSTLGRPWRRGVRLAVSGETVYVGKRDSTLFQSLDEGNSWRDITSNLPLRFTHLKEIVFVGSMVYVATDEGALSSQTGVHWRVLTDGMGTRIVIDRFAGDYTNVFGAGDTGTYRLDDYGKWEQIAPGIRGTVTTLIVSNNKLYIDLSQGGMSHIPLGKLQ